VNGGEERSLGELGRSVDALTAEVRALPGRLEQTYVRKDVYDADSRTLAQTLETLVANVAGLQANQAWIVRAVIGAVVLAILGGVLVTRP
jgi:hypothetical protein